MTASDFGRFPTEGGKANSSAPTSRRTLSAFPNSNRQHSFCPAPLSQALGNSTVAFTDGIHSVASRFFEVRGQLRLEDLTVYERSLVQRDGLSVRTLWRVRGVLNLEKAGDR